MGVFILPIVTTSEREAITPALGELLYDETDGEIYKGNGSTAGGVQVTGSGAGGITESDLINTLRSFALPQWLDVAALTPSAGVFTPDLGTAGSFTADWGANSTLANPIIPSGYETGKVLAWHVTFTVTGAGNWTMDLGSEYTGDKDVDLDAIFTDNNNTGDEITLFCQYYAGVVKVQPFVTPAP